MVSVCMATYNGEKYIEQQLKSILSQIGSNDEVIISDDCSNDKTLEIIKSHNDNRVFIFENIEKMGHVKNFENALLKATGDFIFLSDQDDVWIEDKIKVFVENLKDNDLIVSNFITVDKNLKILKPNNYTSKPKRNLINTLFFKDRALGCCMAFRKEVLKRALPIPKNVRTHDFWIACIGDTFYRSANIENPLIYYRRHDTNASIINGNDMALSGKSSYNFYNKIKYRLLILYNLIKRA